MEETLLNLQAFNVTQKQGDSKMEVRTNISATKIKKSKVILSFFWCIFMGVMVISIGLGVVFPSLNLVAKPFVCSTGKMQTIAWEYQDSPDGGTTTVTGYCVDSKTGTKAKLGMFPMCLYAGTIYGLLLFVVVFVFMRRLWLKWANG